MPVLSAQNVIGGRLSIKTERFTTEDELASFEKRVRPQHGDVLLTIVGTIGRAAVLTEEPRAVLQRSVAILRPNPAVLDSRYLFHATQGGDFRRQLSQATNQSSQAGVYLGKLNKIQIELPPLDEQRRIAGILDRVEEIRFKHVRAGDKCCELLSSLLISELPSGRWELEKLGAVAQINPKAPKIAADTEVSFVGMADLNISNAQTESNFVRLFSEVSKGYTIFADRDILVAKITPCFENNKIGQARLQRGIGVGSTEFHVIRPDARLDSRYLLHFLRQDRIRRQGELRMTGSAGQRRVPADFLKQLEIPLPPLAEQRRIADLLDRSHTLRAEHVGVAEQFRGLLSCVSESAFSVNHR